MEKTPTWTHPYFLNAIDYMVREELHNQKHSSRPLVEDYDDLYYCLQGIYFLINGVEEE